ncbi:MAG: acyl-CoA dehydrogenase family protein [Pseudomonadota bacterium]|nr:acyl-CoA dehydrogenase family protein [Pseudomonadota bacterium]
MTALTALSEDELIFQREIETFARQRIAPLVMAMDAEELFDRDLLAEFFSIGLMGIEIPAKYGGAEGSFFMAILAVEALSKIDPSAGVIVDVQNTLVNNVLKHWGTDAQQQRYYPMLAKDTVGCYCLTEESSGSDAFALQCKATAIGDGYLLNGKKLFITNANEANIFIVFANTDFSQGYRGITSFIVERSNDGLRIGKKESKLGIRSSSTCEVILEDVKVPATNVVGQVGKGYKIAINTLNEGRIGIAAQMLGLAAGALAGAMAYSDERQQFGKTISSFQAVQFKIAELATAIEAARLMTYNAARLRDQDLPFTKEAAMAKLFASQVAEKVASQALELYGGYGFTKEFPAEKYYRDAKIGKIYEGTSNMQLAAIYKLLK